MPNILKNDYSRNQIYKDWIKESTDFFSKCKEEDFFSDKMNHVYFYSEVNKDSVNELMHNLKQLSKTTVNNGGVTSSPKPIVIHLDSKGGDAYAMINFEAFMQFNRVPLCVIIENMCASSATTLALIAPYRVIIEYSDYLIHDVTGISYGKDSEIIEKKYKFNYHWIQNYLTLINLRTSLSESEITEFISRDIWVDNKYCLKKNIVDRILKFKNINSIDKYNKKNYADLNLSLKILLKKTNLNHIYIDSEDFYDGGDIVVEQDSFGLFLDYAKTIDQICICLDKYFLSNMKENRKKQIIIHFLSSWYQEGTIDNVIKLCYRLALLQKYSPIIAFVEGPQANENLSMILMCPIRIMLLPSVITSCLVYGGMRGKLIDVIARTKYIIDKNKSFFKKFSKLPKTFYDNLDKKIINLNPDESLKYKLVHKVLTLHEKKISMRDVIKYLQLNKI